MIQRRRLLAGAGFAAATLAAPSVLRAEPRTVKMGALRLVHSYLEAMTCATNSVRSPVVPGC